MVLRLGVPPKKKRYSRNGSVKVPPPRNGGDFSLIKVPMWRKLPRRWKVTWNGVRHWNFPHPHPHRQHGLDPFAALSSHGRPMPSTTVSFVEHPKKSVIPPLSLASPSSKLRAEVLEMLWPLVSHKRRFPKITYNWCYWCSFHNSILEKIRIIVWEQNTLIEYNVLKKTYIR